MDFLNATTDQRRADIVASQVSGTIAFREAVAGSAKAMADQNVESGGFDATVYLTCLAASQQ